MIGAGQVEGMEASRKKRGAAHARFRRAALSARRSLHAVVVLMGGVSRGGTFLNDDVGWTVQAGGTGRPCGASASGGLEQGERGGTRVAIERGNQKNACAARRGAAPLKSLGRQYGSFSLHAQHTAREPT